MYTRGFPSGWFPNHVGKKSHVVSGGISGIISC